MSKIKYYNGCLPNYEGALVCNEPLCLYVEKAVGDIPTGYECEASPLAFSLPAHIVAAAKEATEKYDIVTVGDGDDIILKFSKEGGEKATHLYYDTIKSPSDFFRASDSLRREIIFEYIEKGVRFTAIDGVVISPRAEIGAGTEIHSATEIRGNTKIGKNCIVGPCSIIENSIVGDNCKINATQIYESVLEDDVYIGPFSHVRPNSRLCSGARIGDFVEIKNSNIGQRTHASHLTYIGDSDVGEQVNIGCGVVTSNYDGKNKHRCTVGNNVFIGCNTNLVAPVTLGDGSYTAAGSTITEDVPSGALGIARARQTNKDGWAENRRKEGKLK